MRILMKEYSNSQLISIDGSAATTCGRYGLRHDPREEVRNAGTVFAAHQALSSVVVTNRHHSRMKIKRAAERGTTSLAAESFLIRTGAVPIYREEVFYMNAVNNYLNLEPEFEKGQVLIALCRNKNPKSFIKSALGNWNTPKTSWVTIGMHNF